MTRPMALTLSSVANRSQCLAFIQELHDWGSELVTDTITELRGYYVKTGQVIARQKGTRRGRERS